METTKYKVVFYCKTDVPSNGRNGYHKNQVFPCSIETHEIDGIFEFIKIQVSPNETYNICPEIHITFCKNADNQNEMLRGFVYMNGQEYTVEQYASFRSLQVENSCYDNIIVIWWGNQGSP
jgi:hypothetical protein